MGVSSSISRNRIALAGISAIAAVMVVAVSAAPARHQATPLPECLPNVAEDSAAIHMRLAAVQAAPAAVLPKIDLARCFDLTWQFENVEQAVEQAQQALEAEAGNRTTLPAEPGVLPLAGVGVATPRRISGTPPKYPDQARADGAAGIVIIEARIDLQGRVRDPRIVRSIKGLDGAALNAVEKWRYAPPLVSGKPADVRVFLPIKFGHVIGQQPADYLDIAAFYYTQGLHQLARGALLSARTAARAEIVRYGRVESAKTLSEMPGFIDPNPVKTFKPLYTAQGMREKITGDVELRLLIDRQGAVGRASIVKPLPYLNIAALDAAVRWTFKPGTLDGQPVSVTVGLVMTFWLYGTG